MERLGCVNPSEYTSLHAVCIILLCTSRGQRWSFEATHALRLKKQFKHALNLIRNKIKLEHYNKESLYPDSPEKFKEKWPAIFDRAFHDGAPVESAVEEEVVHQLRTRA